MEFSTGPKMTLVGADRADNHQVVQNATNGKDKLRRAYTLSIIGVVFMGAALRLYRLGDWPLEGDEINTLRDSLTTVWLDGPKPLLFFLNHHLIAPWMELNELGLRILPCLFGIAAIPIVYDMVRRTTGPRAGLFAAVLVAFSPWHIYWSQYARYYSLVFLLSAIFPAAFYLGLRTRRRLWLLTGVLCGLLAVLAHPSTGLVIGGVGIWFGYAFLRGQRNSGWLHGSSAWIAALLATGIFGLIIFWLLPQLISWYHFPQNWGHAGFALILSYTGWVTAAVLLFGLSGIVWMWLRDDRALARLLTFSIAAPIAFLFFAGFVVPVSTGYLFATAPLIYFGGGYLLDRLAEFEYGRYKSYLISATCLMVAIAAGGPALVSHYRDGSRPNFRTAANYIESEAGDHDIVLADQVRLTNYYLDGKSARFFERDSIPVGGVIEKGTDLFNVWIVAAFRRRGGFNEQGLGNARDWVRRHCTIERAIAQPRLDYRHNEIRVYRCPIDSNPARIARALSRP